MKRRSPTLLEVKSRGAHGLGGIHIEDFVTGPDPDLAVLAEFGCQRDEDLMRPVTAQRGFQSGNTQLHETIANDHLLGAKHSLQEPSPLQLQYEPMNRRHRKVAMGGEIGDGSRATRG